MAKQEYLYPKVPEKDKDGNLASDEVIKFCRNILELFKIKVSKDNKNNEDISGSTYSIATEAEAIAGESEDTIITPLGLRQGLNADGDAPIYACRAWVNFNGTGTVAIRASGNVSSITDNGTWKYQVNFLQDMNSASYVVAGMSTAQSETGGECGSRFLTTGSTRNSYVGRTKSYIKLTVNIDNTALTDGVTVDVAIFE